MELDATNRRILTLLQMNCRMSLTDIGKDVGLSVDSVKKRIDRMVRNDIFFPRIQLRPRNFGYKNVVEIKIKLCEATREEKRELIAHLLKEPHVTEIFEVAGAWDLTIVVIAKDAQHLGRITNPIKNRFNRIVADWTESLTMSAYKFETYDLLKLQEDDHA